MATERYYVCPNCHERTWITTLFDALKDQAIGGRQHCRTCNVILDIELRFNFGLGVGQHECKVLASYTPKHISNWKDDKGNNVEFYPFMVIVKSHSDGVTSVWLPYWHVVTIESGSPNKKYGQWAPFIDSDSYASLAAQAKSDGYLI